MQITTNRLTENFKPVKLELTIESQKELDLLIRIFGLNISIPDILSTKFPNTCKVDTYNMLASIHEKLNNI